MSCSDGKGNVYGVGTGGSKIKPTAQEEAETILRLEKELLEWIAKHKKGK